MMFDVQWHLSRPNLFGTNFCDWNRQVFCLYQLNWQRFPTFGTLLKVWFIQYYSLDRVHCKYIYFSDTSARLVEKGEEEELDHQPIPTSRLRQRAAHLITESDEKYAGKRTSRNKLNDLEQLGMWFILIYSQSIITYCSMEINYYSCLPLDNATPTNGHAY